MIYRCILTRVLKMISMTVMCGVNDVYASTEVCHQGSSPHTVVCCQTEGRSDKAPCFAALTLMSESQTLQNNMKKTTYRPVNINFTIKYLCSQNVKGSK